MHVANLFWWLFQKRPAVNKRYGNIWCISKHILILYFVSIIVAHIEQEKWITKLNGLVQSNIFEM